MVFKIIAVLAVGVMTTDGKIIEKQIAEVVPHTATYNARHACFQGLFASNASVFATAGQEAHVFASQVAAEYNTDEIFKERAKILCARSVEDAINTAE